MRIVEFLLCLRLINDTLCKSSVYFPVTLISLSHGRNGKAEKIVDTVAFKSNNDNFIVNIEFIVRKFSLVESIEKSWIAKEMPFLCLY